MVGGGLLAREVYRQPDPQPRTVLALGSTTVRPPGQQPGPGTAELTRDAALHPYHDEVRRLLQTHFDAINGRDYDRWKLTVTRERVLAKNRTTWLKDFATTRDGSILVYRIDVASEHDLRVLVGFTSTQQPQDAPADLPGAFCVQWKLVLPVTREGGDWKLDSIAAYTSTEATTC